jgi:hypothetical protein
VGWRAFKNSATPPSSTGVGQVPMISRHSFFLLHEPACLPTLLRKHGVVSRLRINNLSDFLSPLLIFSRIWRGLVLTACVLSRSVRPRGLENSLNRYFSQVSGNICIHRVSLNCAYNAAPILPGRGNNLQIAKMTFHRPYVSTYLHPEKIS